MRNDHRGRFLGAIVCVLAGSGLLGSPSAAPVSAVSLTQDMVRRVDRLRLETGPARQKRTLRALLFQRFDFNEFEGKVLKDIATSFTPQQRRRFSHEFRELLGAYLFSKLQNPEAESSLKSCRITEGPTADVVHLTGNNDRSEFEVILYWNAAKTARVVDVSVSGALLSRNYRAMVNKTAREHGIEGLIQKLREKKAGVEQSSVP